MRTALVTGATGLLGSHLVARLRRDGWSVRALVRFPARAGWLEARGAELVRGDLEDPGSLRRAAAGCDAVLHAAAFVSASGSAADFRRGNVDGTRHVVEAAQAAGARLVHVSSTSVYGQSRYRDRPTVEEDPLPLLPPADLYGRSKQEAERVVLGAHGAGRVWATVVRPTVMYGPGDRQLAPRVGPWLLRGVFPLLGRGDTTLTLVHAHSVADGAVRALDHPGAGGRVYNLAHDFDVTVRDFVRLAAEGLGRPVSCPSVPVVLGRAGFRGLSAALALLGRRGLAAHAVGTFRMLTRDNPFSSERARRELGWRPEIPPEDGLPEAFRDWMRRSGRCPRRPACPETVR